MSCDRTHGPDVTRITHLSRKAIKRISSLWALGTGGQSLRQSGAPHLWRVPVRGAVSGVLSAFKPPCFSASGGISTSSFRLPSKCSGLSGVRVYPRARHAAAPARALPHSKKPRPNLKQQRTFDRKLVMQPHIALSSCSSCSACRERVAIFSETRSHTRSHRWERTLGPVAAWQKMVARTVVVAPSLLRF